MSARSTKTRAKRAPSDAATRPAKTRKSVPVEDVWTLRLYITGRGERSERALRNLQNMCEQNLPEGSYQIEVIDLLKNPELAKLDQILAIPTLVRKVPEPMKRVIGDLSNADRALLSLDFPKPQGS
jgi:circadian clock protein KaiB